MDMKNTEATTGQTCYHCGATDQPMTYTKRHGWKCRSAKECVNRWAIAKGFRK